MQNIIRITKTLRWDRIGLCVVLPVLLLSLMFGAVTYASNQLPETTIVDRQYVNVNRTAVSTEMLSKLVACYDTYETKLAIANLVLNASADAGVTVEKIILSSGYSFESVKDLSVLSKKAKSLDFQVVDLAYEGHSNIGTSINIEDVPM